LAKNLSSDKLTTEDRVRLINYQAIMKKIVIMVVIGVLVIVLATYLSTQNAKPVVTNDLASVPSESTLAQNMQLAGLDKLSAEGTVMHIHTHLDVVVNGNSFAVPAKIGIAAGFISPIHTHDTSGVIHIESPVQKDFKLGQFFDEWGVTLNDNCVASYCADNNNKLVAAVNGKAVTAIHEYILKAHDQIELWYGPKATTPSFGSGYSFPSGE